MNPRSFYIEIKSLILENPRLQKLRALVCLGTETLLQNEEEIINPESITRPSQQLGESLEDEMNSIVN